MPSTFEVVAEPTRRRILDSLCREQRSVGELAHELGLSQPTVSKHLKVLRAAQLVQAQISAQRRLYRLSPAPLMELDVWLEPYRKYWNERLDALGRHLDRRAAAAAVPVATAEEGSRQTSAARPRRQKNPTLYARPRATSRRNRP